MTATGVLANGDVAEHEPPRAPSRRTRAGRSRPARAAAAKCEKAPARRWLGGGKEPRVSKPWKARFFRRNCAKFVTGAIRVAQVWRDNPSGSHGGLEVFIDFVEEALGCQPLLTRSNEQRQLLAPISRFDPIAA